MANLSKKEIEILKLYEKGQTDEQIAKQVGVTDRTVRRYLTKLRQSGVIDYRTYQTPSKVLQVYNQKEAEEEAKDILSETELIKFLSLYKSKNKVAETLKISSKEVSRLCEKYQIEDIGESSKKIINVLKETLKDTEPYQIRKPVKTKGDTLVIQLTDIHGGKIIKDQTGNIIYNESICKARMDKLCYQALKLLDNNIRKGVSITNVVILATGDLANGAEIYATQAYEQEMAPPKQVMLIVEIIYKLMLSLVERGLNVEFYGIKGNHGRLGKDADPTANWDLMIYMILDLWVKTLKAENKIKVTYAETDYLTCEIRGHRYMIRHIAPEQCDTAGGRVKINEWARQHNIEAVVYGHFHHWGIFDVDGITVFRGGSVPGGDDFSEQMAKHSDPVQLVWGVNEKRVKTFMYAVDLASK